MGISKEVKVGFFAIVAIATLYLGFNYLKGIDFLSRSNRYYVLYEDVGGLTKSNPIKISGFSVGKVSNITLLQNEGNIVLVEMDIEDNIILGDSAVARLDADLLGSVSIVIGVGDVSRPLQPGDTLLARVNPGLAELFKESTEPLKNNLPILISNLNDLLEDLHGTGNKLKEALASFTTTSNTLNNTLNENRDTLQATINQFKAMAVNLNNTITEVQPVLASFGTLADSLSNLELHATLDKLDLLLEETTSTVTALGSEEGTLGKLMHDDALYNNLNQAMLDLDTLLVHIEQNPKHFFGPLGQKRKKIEKDLAKQNSQK